MENGFIFIPREFLDGSIWKEKRAYSEALALIDLHMMARYGAGPAEVVVANRRVRVEHGQLVASLRYLASRWRWSVGRVRRFVALLRDGGWIAADTTEGILRITVSDGVGRSWKSLTDSHLRTAGAYPGVSRSWLLPPRRGTLRGTLPAQSAAQRRRKEEKKRKKPPLREEKKGCRLLPHRPERFFSMKGVWSPVSAAKPVRSRPTGLRATPCGKRPPGRARTAGLAMAM